MYIGIEKENLIFSQDLKPKHFKLSELPKNITLDYADNQIEFVSDVFDDSVKLIKQMYDLMDHEMFNDTVMWPLSNPGFTYDVSHNGFDNDECLTYRKHLESRYDRNLLTTSGIHFNFSFEDETSKEFYFDFLKKIYVFGPLLQQFVSYTPFFEPGMYDDGLDDIDFKRGFKNSMSLRNSTKYGYYNEHLLNLDYTSYETFRASILKNIDEQVIECEKEIYSKIRLKEYNNKTYLELRFIDINPYNRLGISLDSVDKIVSFLETLRDVEMREFDIDTCLENFEQVAINGRDKDMVMRVNGSVDTLYNHTINLLQAMCKCDNKRQCVIHEIIEEYTSGKTDFDRLIKDYNGKTVYQLGREMAFMRNQFTIGDEYAELELSTQILIDQALKDGYEVNVLDKYANAIEIKNDEKAEIVFQATKTSKDNYASVLVMENKYLTKKVLADNGVNVAAGITMEYGEQVDLSQFAGKKVVIKPLDTNFGLGISIIEYSEELMQKAIELAFEYSKKIIIEEFFEGQEFRLLVIDGEVVSVVKRIPANVVGDGVSTIKQLVDKKNLNPLRGTGYKKPVEKIKLGDFERDFLADQGLDFESVIESGQTVYLRENSNVSTGGDSAEVSDVIPVRFKRAAVAAALALDSKICGIDMIISPEFNEYAIIEANFNPAIHMHTYPFIGHGKNIAKKVLDLLFN